MLAFWPKDSSKDSESQSSVIGLVSDRYRSTADTNFILAYWYKVLSLELRNQLGNSNGLLLGKPSSYDLQTDWHAMYQLGVVC